MELDTLLTSVDVQPRPYQQRIVRKAVSLFAEQGLRSVLIDSPTGSGKTIMALLIARAMQDQLGVRVGWVAMRRYLLAQAQAENESKRIGVNGEFISMFDRDPPTGLDLLVVDEAQHDAAQSMAHLHQRIRPRFILGLSATPFRADRVKLCFDSVLKDAGIQCLIQDGYLSPYHHYTLPRYTPEDVVACYLRDRDRWGKTLLYFHTLDQCARANQLLRAGGVRSDVVSGSSDRDAQLEKFRDGRLEVLANCMMLSEGFDCPELKTVFCRPSCKGVTVQMAGRVLRKHPALPIKQIVQCPRTRWPFPRTAAPALQFAWTGSAWRSLQINPLINQVNGRMLQALARTEVTLPAWLVNKQPRQRRGRDRLQPSFEE
jgi:superfamily II DNA or RNA helicase